jgi:tetratricopeptide (TPR) repeat protein
MYENLRSFDSALEYYNKSLTILTKILGSESIRVATTLSNIGSVYCNKGEYKDALENYNKCLEI